MIHVKHDLINIQVIRFDIQQFQSQISPTFASNETFDFYTILDWWYPFWGLASATMLCQFEFFSQISLGVCFQIVMVYVCEGNLPPMILNFLTLPT